MEMAMAAMEAVIAVAVAVIASAVAAVAVIKAVAVGRMWRTGVVDGGGRREV